MKTKNKLLKALLAALLTLSLIFGVIPVPGLTMEAHAASGTCGENLTWTLDDQGVLTISGTGAMQDYAYNNQSPWGHDIKQVVINDGVTSIGAWAFDSCRSLTSITFPDSVTSIGECAFYACRGLTGITLPVSLISIGNHVFNSCSGLTSITLPDGLTSIGFSAFSGCRSLTGITLPDGLTSIGESAFSGCNSLTGITLPDGLMSIEDTVFYDCRSLTGITLPDSLTSIGECAFYRCSSLQEINASADNPNYASEDGVLFSKDKKELIAFPAGWGDYYTISTGVTSIGNGAFSGCNSLTSITLPNGLISIGDYAFSECGIKDITLPDSLTSIGEDAFYDCSGLESVTFSDNLTNIGKNAFERCSGLKDITLPAGLTSIEEGAFSECSGLTGITLPGSLTSIGDSAFTSCSSLTGITLPDGVTGIEGGAFSGCSSLTSITLPASVTRIEDYAFYECGELKNVYYEGTADSWDKITVGDENDCLINATKHYGAVPVDMVLLSAETLTLKDGETSDLTATVYPSYANNKNVTWESSDTSVATVADGTVTCVAPGEAVITIKSVDGNKSASCSVKVLAIPVNGVTLDKATLALKVGGTGCLTATVAPDNASYKNVTWESSNTAVATVADGTVTAAAPGEAVITVRTVSGNKTATCTVTVSEVRLTGIALDKSEAELAEGEKLTLTVSFTPADAANKNVTWSSSDETVATVAGGEVTAVKAGKAVIKAVAADGGYEAKCEITVKGKVTDPEPQTPDEPESPLGPDKPDLSQYTASGNEIAVKSINLKKSVFSGVKGTKKFVVTSGDAATVRIKGSTLTVLRNGTVTIAAFDKKSEKLAEKTINVIAPSVATAQPTEINRRGTLDLNRYIISTVKPSGWKSSNKKTAEVSSEGLLTIKKSGTVKITVTFPAEKGMTAKKLTIKLKIAMPQFKKTTYTVKTGKTVKTAVRNAAASDITYRIEDQTIATVDTEGKVTGVSKGTTKLIMTVKGIDYETKIKVK